MSRCLRKNTKITTVRGLVDIQDIRVGDLVLTLSGYKKVYDVIQQDIHNVIKIITITGHYIYCTKNHKIAVKRKNNGYVWKQAYTLTSKDELFVGHPAISGTLTTLPHRIYKNTTIPTIDIELAWFLGVLLVAGKVVLNTISITFCESANCIIPDIVQQLKRFNPSITFETTNIEALSLTKLSCSDAELVLYFTTLLTNIPDVLLQSSLFIKYAFISGILDVRYINNKVDVTLFRSQSESIARSLHLLITSIGVATLLYLKNTYYVIKINRYALNHVAKYCHNPKFYNTSIRRTILNSISARRSYVSTVYNIEQTNIEDETWDLSVEDNHQFYADGILVSTV
jgi:intein/homing endonuclease